MSPESERAPGAISSCLLKVSEDSRRDAADKPQQSEHQPFTSRETYHTGRFGGLDRPWCSLRGDPTDLLVQDRHSRPRHRYGARVGFRIKGKTKTYNRRKG